MKTARKSTGNDANATTKTRRNHEGYRLLD
jgi:hypothetical protein